MAATSEDVNEVINFEEGLSWLPSHVLVEALCDNYPPPKKDRNIKQQYHRHILNKLPAEHAHKSSFNQNPKPSSRAHHRHRHSMNWASNGAGMQAFFLDSGQRSSSGTGVFLPRRTGTSNIQPNKKPACSPVLLPTRVVQALNLNVHKLGLQVSPRQDSRSNNGRKDGVKVEVAATKCGAANSSPPTEIFLPKEWTY